MGKWCALCKCDGPSYKGETSFKCPLVSSICSTCCYYDLDAGMGAQDTLKNVIKITKKTAQQIHATCRKCKNGGPHAGEPGEIVETDLAHEKEILELERLNIERLKWLRGKRKTRPKTRK